MTWDDAIINTKLRATRLSSLITAIVGALKQHGDIRDVIEKVRKKRKSREIVSNNLKI
jgi:hypothetical protein